MAQTRLTPSFQGEDAITVQRYLDRVRESTKVPDLSATKAIMIAVRKELERMEGEL